MIEYGECGLGAYCLGGCDPRMSFSLDACVPAPVCKDKTYKMDSLDGIVEIDKYYGDASTADWVYQGEPLVYNGNILLTMAAHSVGTVLATSDYIWYGNIKANLKTSRGAGVVTAFILLSDVKDEIDYEFVGTELGIAQTNYYFQGIPNCRHPPRPLFSALIDVLTLAAQMTTLPTSRSPTRMRTFTSTRSSGLRIRSPGSSMARLDASRRGPIPGTPRPTSGPSHRPLLVSRSPSGPLVPRRTHRVLSTGLAVRSIGTRTTSRITATTSPPSARSPFNASMPRVHRVPTRVPRTHSTMLPLPMTL